MKHRNSLKPCAWGGRGLISLSATAMLAIGVLSSAHGQTAHYVGIQSVLYQSQLYVGGVAVDSSNNVYISDSQANRVVKLTASGGGYSAPAVVVSGLNNPKGVAVDSSGNVYVADSGNNRVIKVPYSGGQYGTAKLVDNQFGGVQFIAADSSGNVYISDPDNHRVLKDKLSNGSYTQTVLISNFSNPSGIAVNGSVYVADRSRSLLDKLPLLGNGSYGTLTQVATPTSPNGVAADASGNVYVADNSGQVYKETLSGTTYSSSTLFRMNVDEIAVDSAGNLYTDNTGTSQVQKLLPGATPNFGDVAVGGTSSAITALVHFDSSNSVAVTTLTGGASGLDFECSYDGPNLQISPDDSVAFNLTFAPLFAGTRNGVLQLTLSGTTPVVSVPVTGTGTSPQAAFYPGAESLPFAQAQLDPEGLAVDYSGTIYIADAANNRILKEAYELGDYTVTGIGGLNQPSGIAVDAAGNLYIADTGNGRVLKETLSGGSYTQSLVMTSSLPFGVAVDGQGVVYIADPYDGLLTATPVSSGGYTSGWVPTSISYPNGVAVDGTGAIYVSDSRGPTVLRGSYIGNTYVENYVSSGGLNPSGIAVDALGNVAIADLNSNQVLEEVVASGQYTQLLAGNGFSQPSSVAVDQEGTIYVGDSGNHRVVRIDVSGPQALSFAATVAGSTGAAQTINYANIGNSPLTFPTFSGGNPNLAGPWVLDNASTCAPSLAGTSIDAGSTCSFVLDFAPTGIGASTGALTFVDTSRNMNYAVQAVELTGTGVVGTKTITFPQPSSPALQGGSDLLTATASNGDPVTYSITGGTATLNGPMVTYTTAGSVTLTASSVATGTYAAATPVSVTVSVLPGQQSISWVPSTLSIYTGAALGTEVLDATDTVPASITYTSTPKPNGTAQSVNTNTVLPMGQYILTAIVTPNNLSYATTSSALPFNVQNMNPFISNSAGNVSSLYNNGTQQSSSVAGGGVGAAVDSNGLVWSITNSGSALTTFTDTGSTASTFSNLGLNGARALAVDGLGQVWVANSNNTLTQVSNTGAPLATTTDAGLSGPTGVAIDMSGNVWISNGTSSSVDEVIGAAAPAAPLANAVQSLSPGTRP